MTDNIEIVHRSCAICEASCGLRVHVNRAEQRVERIDGDDDDPRSRGYLCPKAYAMKEIYEDPDRLRRPLRKRADGSWEELDWEQALDYAAERLQAVRDAHGAQALGYYIGNPTGHNAGGQLYVQPLIMSLGTPRSFSAATMDQFPQNVALREMVGDGWMMPVPDLDHCDYFLCLGGNPLASQGSLMSAPNIGKRLRALREAGGRVVVLDPRRTETAEVASQHVFIRPGTDAWFLLAFVNVLFAEDRVRPGRLAEFTDGIDEMRALSEEFTPEAVAPITGIDADLTRRIVREFCDAKRPVCYGRIGLCTQEFGTLASWLVYAIDALTGRLDAVGGMMFTRPATGNAEPGPEAEPMSVGAYRTVLRGLPEVDGQLPCGAMAEEIEEASAGDARMRALITVCGNPVLSAPNGPRLASALEELDFMVAVDIYLNETTRHADLILPSTVQLEHENYDFLFQTTSIRNMARWSPAVFEPEPDTMDHWRILLELGARYVGTTAEDLDAAMVRTMAGGLVGPGTRCPEVTPEQALEAIGETMGPMRLLDLMIRSGPYGDGFDDTSSGLRMETLRNLPHALDLGALEPRLPGVLKTPGRRLRLAPEYLTADLSRLRASSDRRLDDGRMLMIGRRQMRNMNSWLHNLPHLARGRNRCTLLMSVKDADRLGVRDRESVRVRSRSGHLDVECEVTDAMMPGVVSLPHGFGHGREGTRLGVANQVQPGVCSNDLTDELPLDVPSGTHIANGIPVEVERLV
ncbi:molybdopterin-dependent oxidoreductase [Myxococcota bacterium]|nr:molybdopterin-dependent oxidoreductase [Myxococcota bacterium]